MKEEVEAEAEAEVEEPEAEVVHACVVPLHRVFACVVVALACAVALECCLYLGAELDQVVVPNQGFGSQSVDTWSGLQLRLSGQFRTECPARLQCSISWCHLGLIRRVVEFPCRTAMHYMVSNDAP